MPVAGLAKALTEMLYGSIIFLGRLVRVELPFHPQHFSGARDEQKCFGRHPVIALVVIGWDTALISKSDDPFSPITILECERLIDGARSVPSTAGEPKETARVDRLRSSILNEPANLGDKRITPHDLCLHQSFLFKSKPSVPTH